MLLSGAVELPCYLLIGWALQSVGRRVPMAASMLAGGLSCVLCATQAVQRDPASLLLFALAGKVGRGG